MYGEARTAREYGATHKKLAKDFEAKFAAEFARSLGRYDWWNLRDEHTPFQWQTQLAMYAAAPWGDRRADLRQGLSTANLMLAQSSQDGRTEEAFRQILSALIDYLPGSSTEETADLQALALMRAEQNG